MNIPSIIIIEFSFAFSALALLRRRIKVLYSKFSDCAYPLIAVNISKEAIN